MEPAERIVYFSVWLALVCYPAGAVGMATDNARARNWARVIWTVACLVFWLHVTSAFGVFYEWRHSVALVETARQTLAATGFDSGAGLYLNYLFALLWTVEVGWWWRRPQGYRARPLALFALVHGFFLFMIANGAVIFVSGPRRWLGLLVLAVGAMATAWALVVRVRGE